MVDNENTAISSNKLAPESYSINITYFMMKISFPFVIISQDYLFSD